MIRNYTEVMVVNPQGKPIVFVPNTAIAVTTSDTATFQAGMLFVGVGGDVKAMPAGGHDAYLKGDKVYFPTVNDAIYESKINANVWSPTAYAAGWLKL